ncbi:MAG: flagellar basal-body MS-ring/collar protein FliF [Pseudomonadota bacterium]
MAQIFGALDMRRKFLVVGATLAMFAGILLMTRIASEPRLDLLYSGLDPAVAGDVLQSLEAAGATYEVRGSAIYVDATKRDALRLTLASEGKPAQSAQGYELLDSLTGFGTTSQMFDAAYWRAKEGELARTILAADNVASARVHIANVDQRPFARSASPSASVTITTRSGPVAPEFAEALTHLIASAVTGMEASAVSVIDSRTGLVATANDLPGGVHFGRGDRSELMKRRIERLLEARVGPGNAVVEVSIDYVTETEQITERRVDPDTRVAISSDTEERTTSNSENRNGAVTVASNLPDGDANAEGPQSSSQNAETREVINYEVSETQREVLRGPGSIRRISVAVLVNGVRVPGPDGARIWEPRSDAELASLRDLVSSAAGIDEKRGDQVTLRTLEFPKVAVAGTDAPSAGTGLLSRLDPVHSLQIALIATVVLVIALFVVRPVLLARPVALESEPTLSRPTAQTLQPDPPSEGLPALTGEIDDGAFAPPEMAVVSEPLPDLTIADAPDLAPLPGQPDDPVHRLKRLIEERQNETVEVIRGWMEDRGERA